MIPNLDELDGLISSFYINGVERQSIIYAVVRKGLVEGNYTLHMGDLLRGCIRELLYLNPKVAKAKLRYFKNVITELLTFDNESNNHIALNKFRSLCLELNINYIGPPPFDHSKLTITQNFIDDLKDELTTRLEIISELERALILSTNSPSIEEVSLDLPIPERHVRAIDNALMPGEFTMKEWDVICTLEDTYVYQESIVTYDQSVSNDIDIAGAKLAVQQGKSASKQKDFKNDILNEKGKAICDKLISNYSGKVNKPQDLAKLILALDAGGYLSIDVKTAGRNNDTDTHPGINKHDLSAFNTAFKANVSAQAVVPQLNKNYGTTGFYSSIKLSEL